MRISEVLSSKPIKDVITVAPDATVRELVALLAQHNVGALVVCEGESLAGIVSERDVVRRLRDRGAALLDAPVSEIMTTEVHTVEPGENVDSLRQTMTTQRFRHMPVVEDGRLVGIVSIGDVVKSAIEELETEKASLVDYLHR